MESPGRRNAILSLNPFAALSLATNPGFHVIHSTEPAAPLGPLGRVATKVIPVYLQDLCARKLWFDLAMRIRALDLLYDMAQWLGRRGGDPAAVKKAESVLFASGQSPHIPFLWLVYRLYDNGRLPVVRADFDLVQRTKAAIVYQPSAAEMPDSVWIPMRSLNRLLGTLEAPALDTTRISKSLEGQPGFLRVAEYRGEAGWVFEDSWWTARYREHCGTGGGAQEVRESAGRYERPAERLPSRCEMAKVSIRPAWHFLRGAVRPQFLSETRGIWRGPHRAADLRIARPDDLWASGG